LASPNSLAEFEDFHDYIKLPTMQLPSSPNNILDNILTRNFKGCLSSLKRLSLYIQTIFLQKMCENFQLESYKIPLDEIY